MDTPPLTLARPSQPRSPGWYPDPTKRGRLRLWDGNGWTTDVVVRTRPERNPKEDKVIGAVITLWVMGGSFALSSLLVVSAGQSAIEPIPSGDLATAVGVLAVVHLVLALVMLPLVSFAGGRRHPFLTALWSVLCGGAGLVVGILFGAVASMNGQELC